MYDQLLVNMKRSLDYDPETGVFTYRIRVSQMLPGQSAGRVNKTCGYIEISVKSRKYQAHRLAILYVTGTWPTGDVDHINGIRTDNRLSNLRVVSRSVNCQNRRQANKTKTTDLLGAYWDKKMRRFTSYIYVNGKSKYLGSYETEQAAHQAYLTAKRVLHPGCTI